MCSMQLQLQYTTNANSKLISMYLKHYTPAADKEFISSYLCMYLLFSKKVWPELHVYGT